MKGFEKYKEMINNTNYKKMIYNLVTIIIVCVIALLSWDTFFPSNKTNPETKLVGNVKEKEQAQESNYKDSLELQLKQILSQIKGVGAVEVMVTYESTAEVVPAINKTQSNQVSEEKDAQGGTRTTKQDDQSESIITSTNGTGQLIVLKEIKPQIRGVVVVAAGAGDIRVKTELIEAVKTIFQVPAHKVMVYEKE